MLSGCRSLFGCSYMVRGWGREGTFSGELNINFLTDEGDSVFKYCIGIKPDSVFWDDGVLCNIERFYTLILDKRFVTLRHGWTWDKILAWVRQRLLQQGRVYVAGLRSSFLASAIYSLSRLSGVSSHRRSHLCDPVSPPSCLFTLMVLLWVQLTPPLCGAGKIKARSRPCFRLTACPVLRPFFPKDRLLLSVPSHCFVW